MTALILSCLKVFFSRILDMTIGSVRTILMVREKTLLAAVCGFFEVLVWFIVVRDALNSDGPMLPIAISYSLGFATGTFVGGTLAKLLVRGHVTVHVVTGSRDKTIPDALRSAGFGITVMDVNGSEFGEEKYLILADLDSKRLAEFQSLLHALDEHCFILVQETKTSIGGYGGFRRKGK